LRCFPQSFVHTQGVTTSALPDLDQLDNEALKALLAERHLKVVEMDAALAALEAEFAAQRQKARRNKAMNCAHAASRSNI